MRRAGEPARCKSFRLRKDAAAWAAEVEAAWEEAPPVKVEDPLVVDLFGRYLQEVTPKKKGARVEGYRIASILRSLPGGLSLRDVDRALLAKWRDERAKTHLPSSVRLDLMAWSHLFSIMRKEWGFEVENPVEMIAKPRCPGGRERRVSEDELRRLLQSALRIPQLGDLVLFALETGLRRTTLVGLKVEARSGCLIHVPMKSKDDRWMWLPLSPLACEILDRQPARADGRYWRWEHPDSLSHAFNKACKEAGIEGLRFHDLRHEATSRLIEKGLSPAEAMKVTGHLTLQMLSRYYHADARALAEKLAAL